MIEIIRPHWQVPKHIQALTTTTLGGVSQGSYASFNLGEHVGDQPNAVAKNRQILSNYLGASVALCWLNQIHSDICIDLSSYHGVVDADAATTNRLNQACVVMTADCLPVLLCDSRGQRVAALHCGWKGLLKQLIPQVIHRYFSGESVTVWLGPAIAPQSYEVDEPIYQQFIAVDWTYQRAFEVSRSGHYYFNLYTIARQQLLACGVADEAITGGAFNTFSDPRCYSYRRNARAGRMATLIYKTPQ